MATKYLRPRSDKEIKKILEEMENPPPPPSQKLLNFFSTINTPTSELVLMVDSNSFFNVIPKDYFNFSKTEVDKINFDVMMTNQQKNKKIIISHIKFEDNFKKAIRCPTEKTKKAADFYPDWFKMCCHLKFLFSENEEKGLELFKLFSSLSEKYREKDCEKLWNNCKPNFGFIPGVFSIIDFPKYEPAKIPKRKQIIKDEFF